MELLQHLIQSQLETSSHLTPSCPLETNPPSSSLSQSSQTRPLSGLVANPITFDALIVPVQYHLMGICCRFCPLLDHVIVLDRTVLQTGTPPELEQEGFYFLVLGLFSFSLAGSRGLHTTLLTCDPPAERDETLSTSTSTSRTRDLVKQGVLIDNTLTPLSTLLYYSSSTSISTSFFFSHLQLVLVTGRLLLFGY